MRRERTAFPPFAITNPNKAWVSQEIDKLLSEWNEWLDFCSILANKPDSEDYTESGCAEILKDGRVNMHKHAILREKTLVFMRNHFSGAEFVLENWPEHPHEDNMSRLFRIIPTWIHRLQTLKASMDYVLVPEGYWKAKGSEFLTTLSKSTAENAIDVASSYLRNPLSR